MKAFNESRFVAINVSQSDILGPIIEMHQP